MDTAENSIRRKAWARWLCPVSVWLACFAIAMQLVRGYRHGRVAQAVALTARTGGRTPEFNALADAVAQTADTLMFLGFAVTFITFVLLVISAARRHWSKLHSAAVVLLAAALLLGTLLV